MDAEVRCFGTIRERREEASKEVTKIDREGQGVTATLSRWVDTLTGMQLPSYSKRFAVAFLSLTLSLTLSLSLSLSLSSKASHAMRHASCGVPSSNIAPETTCTLRVAVRRQLYIAYITETLTSFVS